MGMVFESSKKLSEPADVATEIRLGNYHELSQDQAAYARWSFSRCVPTSAVPLP